MKKITLLFFLLVVSLGYSQELPFDFENPNQLMLGDGGATVTIIDDGSTTNDVLQIVGASNNWDNAQINFPVPVDLSNSVNNTITVVMECRDCPDLEVRQHGLGFQSNVAEVNFETVGKELTTVELNFPSNLGSYGNMKLYTDSGTFGDGSSNNQSTGTYWVHSISAPGPDPETCSDGIENQDETGVDCGGVCAPCDVTAPSGFTATIGAIDPFSIELLLTATDETSANITYDIAGDVTAQTIGASGVETSYIISGLTPETMYSFDVSASDASGNSAANNAITVGGTTIADPSNECEGQSFGVKEGTFPNGYAYKFETLGNGDVEITFTLLGDPVAGLVAYIQNRDPFSEGNFDSNVGQAYTKTIIAPTPGVDITYGAKFVWADGGFGVTEDFVYTVGEECVLGIDDVAKASFKIFPNPTQDSWTVKTQSANISSIKVFDVLGKNVLSLSPNTSEATIDGASLNKGLYFAQIKTASGISSLKLIKQ